MKIQKSRLDSWNKKQKIKRIDQIDRKLDILRTQIKTIQDNIAEFEEEQEYLKSILDDEEIVVEE